MTEQSVADLTSATTQSPPSNSAHAFDPQPIFLSESDIQDFAVRLAMSGIRLEDGLFHFDAAKAARIEALNQEWAARKATISKWIGEWSQTVSNLRLKIDAVLEESTRLRNVRFQVEITIQTLHLKKATLALAMRISQLEAQQQFFKQESEELGRKQTEIEQEISRTKEAELEYARKLHSSLLEIWDLDSEELRRRAGLLQAEVQEVDEALSRVEETIRNLRDVGVTRTVAGFLLWVGYTAFAGVGSVFGTLLQRRQADPTSTDLLGNFIRGFASFFGLQQGNVFTWHPFLSLLGFLGAALAVIILITLGADWILQRFNRNWKRSGDRRNPQVKANKSSNGWKNFVTAFTEGSNRLGLFTGTINRRDYTQLLAIIPYLGLGAIIVFVVSALGVTMPTGSGQGGSTATTLTAASIGAVFTLISTSVCLLYAAKIAEPRWLRHIKQAQTGGITGGYVRASWELVALVLLLIAVVLAITFLPLGEPNDYRAWGITALFMVMGSAGLAYGIMYRGVFRDHDSLKRTRQEYLSEIEEFILKPTLNDVFENTDPQELKDSADKYRRARQYLDGLRIGNELREIFVEHPEYDGDFSRFWFDSFDATVEGQTKFPRSPNRRLRRLIQRLGFGPSASGPPRSSWRTAPQESEEYQACEQQIRSYQQQIEQIGKRLAELEAEKTTTDIKVLDGAQQLREHEIRLFNVQSECAKRLREYELQRQRDEVTFTSAFLAGKMVHDYLVQPSPAPAG